MNSDHGDERVALEISFHIFPSHRQEFLQTVESLMSPTSEIPGLSALTCFEQLGEANVFLWRESWASVDELENRLRTKTIKTLLGAIEVLGKLHAFEVLRPSSRSRSHVEKGRRECGRKESSL